MRINTGFVASKKEPDFRFLFAGPEGFEPSNDHAASLRANSPQGQSPLPFSLPAPFFDRLFFPVFVEKGRHGSYIAEVARDIIDEYFGMQSEKVIEDNSITSYSSIIN